MISSSVLRAPSLARVPHKAYLSLFGSQTAEFLNGVLATSIHQPLRQGLSTVMNAQGRVLYDVFLYSQKDEKGKPGYILEYDARETDTLPLLDVLKRYVLRSKVKIRDVSEQFDTWSAWGSTQSHLELARKWQWARSGAVEPVWDQQNEWAWGTQDGVIHDRRAPGMGKRMLVRKGDTPPESLDHNVVDGYTLHRLLLGVPEGVLDIPPAQAFPMDSNLDMMGGLDFRKGCYIGQELTVRTYHTGVVRKRVYPVSFERISEASASSTLSPGLSVNVLGSRRSVGKLLTCEGGHGLALLRTELVNSGDQQFKVKDEAGEEWNILPSVPEWWPLSPPPNETSIDSTE